VAVLALLVLINYVIGSVVQPLLSGRRLDLSPPISSCR
jgi:predicted PurR-regulated permease PerM